jgi:hypothetical protein
MPPKGSKKQVKATKTMKEDEENPNAFMFSDTSHKVGVNCKEWNRCMSFWRRETSQVNIQKDSDKFVDICRSTLHKITVQTSPDSIFKHGTLGYFSCGFKHLHYRK